MDREISYLFDDFLTNDGVKDKVLSRTILPVLTQRLGALSYGQCYLAFPSAMFGGDRAIEDYSTGDLDVYLSIAGQTVSRDLVPRRGK